MAIIARDWVPGKLMRFDDLCFVINLVGGLECICSSYCSIDIVGSDASIDSLRGLRLEVSEGDISACTQHPLVDHEEVEQQRLQL